MEYKKIINIAVIFTFGFAAGATVNTLIVNSKSKFGVLKIDKSKDEKDVYSLELGDLDDLEGKKRVILKIQEINNAREKHVL